MQRCAFVVVVVVLAPALAWAQYIGNPAGKAVPRGAPDERHHEVCGFAGFDFGYGSYDVEGDYDVVTGGNPERLHSVSQLKESYFAASIGGNFSGFEIEGRLGGAWIDIDDDQLTEDPLDDSGGVLAGMGARYGFSPCELLRLGLGGQFQYSYSEGDTMVSDGRYYWHEDTELDLFRGELFAGASLDLEASRDVTFSPYLGAGLEFISGELSVDVEDPYGWVWYEDDVGDIEEENVGFLFGGLDLHLGQRFRIGMEGRTDCEGGWLANMSFGVRF
jgi:opacity protein-like surface antigen